MFLSYYIKITFPNYISGLKSWKKEKKIRMCYRERAAIFHKTNHQRVHVRFISIF